MKRILYSTIICSCMFIQILFSQNLELLGQIVVQPGEFVTDVWGYVDSSDGKEYAIVGSFNGMEIIDVTDPQNMQQVYNSNALPGFDMKVWKNYLYLVTGGGGANLGKILDITDPSNPAFVGSFNSSHNIFISEDGYLFAESPGLVVYNLNNTPASPEFLWSDGTGGGHDATVIENRVYDFHGGATNIYEFSTTADFTMQQVGSVTTPLIQYHHSGWVTDNDQYLFICDELSNHPTPDITVWDISNLNDPVKVEEYADPGATVHNLYIIGNYAYVAYYTAGFRIFDISDPENIEVAAHYDTNPATGQGYDGAFGVYPFLPSGNILVSDQTGLYVFKFNDSNIPIELISFTADISDGDVILNWETATEINNSGFEVQRGRNNTEFSTIAFVEGYGTTTELQSYSYTDKSAEKGKYYYRLKQTDFEGNNFYSDIVQVDVGGINFMLEQNYPNPFNPSTKIRFDLPRDNFVSLKVYDAIGNEVAVLIQEEKPAGEYEVKFSAEGLVSGIYFYELRSGDFISTKKMILLK